jgi:hypothetical protein
MSRARCERRVIIPSARLSALVLAGAALVQACEPAGATPESDTSVEDVGSAAQVSEREAQLTYANLGRQPISVNACFVLGPTPSTVTQADLTGIMNTVNEWTQGDTNLRFTWASTLSSMTTIILGGNTYMTSCTKNSAGNYNERFRLYIDVRNLPTTSVAKPPVSLVVPGTGCTYPEEMGSGATDSAGNLIQDPVTKLWKLETGFMWSMFPDQMASNQTCLYTLHLGTGQARNNYLHESGHGLGWSHEQDRSDATCLGKDPVTGAYITTPGVAGTKVTNYDTQSPMHYVLACPDGTTTPGNWGSGGLTGYDRLGIELTYPLSLGARMVVRAVSWTGGDQLWGTLDWVNRGARVSSTPGEAVLSNVRWSIDGRQLSTQLSPTTAEWRTLAVGRHTLRLQFSNTWGDAFDSSTVVEVLGSQAEYNNRTAAALTFL